MPDAVGSYDPRAFVGGVPAEMERLERQAALTWPEEARLLGELGLCDAAVVLEVGCGSGAFLARLRQLMPAAALVAVEPDEELAAAARSRVPDAQILAGTAERIPLEDATVGAAVARFVFQHLYDPATAVGELLRVLHPGGLLTVIEVDGGVWGLSEPSFPEVAEVYAKVWMSQWQRGGDRMIGRRLPKLLRGAGFTDVGLRLYGYSSFEHGLDAFETHLDPVTLRPFLADGTISSDEYAAAQDAYRRFRADPDAFVLLAGVVASGRRA